MGRDAKAKQERRDQAALMRAGGTTAIHSVRASSVTWSGPLPPPELLAKYDAVQPGFADRIMTMAETQSAHRQALEHMAVSGIVAGDRNGMRYAFALATLLVGAGVWLISQGITIAGVCTLFSVIAAVVIRILRGDKKPPPAQLPPGDGRDKLADGS
jgi:uncharacterized membrane protein